MRRGRSVTTSSGKKWLAEELKFPAVNTVGFILHVWEVELIFTPQICDATACIVITKISNHIFSRKHIFFSKPPICISPFASLCHFINFNRQIWVCTLVVRSACSACSAYSAVVKFGPNSRTSFPPHIISTRRHFHCQTRSSNSFTKRRGEGGWVDRIVLTRQEWSFCHILGKMVFFLYKC